MKKYFILLTIILLIFISVYGTLTFMKIYDDDQKININGFEIEKHNLDSINEFLEGEEQKQRWICNMKTNECFPLGSKMNLNDGN